MILIYGESEANLKWDMLWDKDFREKKTRWNCVRQSSTGKMANKVWKMDICCNTAWLHSLTSHQQSFSIPCIENHPPTKRVFQCQTSKKDLNGRGSALVTNKAGLVSFRQQIFIWLCVINWVGVIVVSNFMCKCVCLILCVYMYVSNCVCLILFVQLHVSFVCF